MTPGIVLKSRFIMPSTSNFKNYVSYLSREQAKQPQKSFESYMNYMGDSVKKGALFTQTYPRLNQQQQEQISMQFQQAQHNGSPLWQDVISFDNDWLAQQGLYDKVTQQVDEERLRTIIREAVLTMLVSERMTATAIWTAAIHYNTDNIHVHVATVEVHPTREKQRKWHSEMSVWKEEYRAKRKPHSLEAMKSKVANLIIDRSYTQQRITEIIREAVGQKRNHKMTLSYFKDVGRLYQRARIALPQNKKEWRYGYQKVNEARPFIDKLGEKYLQQYQESEVRELHQLLDKEAITMQQLYGEESGYKNYKKGKLDDLTKRLGNAILSEMRTNELQKEAIKINVIKDTTVFSQRLQFNRALQKLNYRMHKTFYDYKKACHFAEYERSFNE